MVAALKQRWDLVVNCADEELPVCYVGRFSSLGPSLHPGPLSHINTRLGATPMRSAASPPWPGDEQETSRGQHLRGHACTKHQHSKVHADTDPTKVVWLSVSWLGGNWKERVCRCESGSRLLTRRPSPATR